MSLEEALNANTKAVLELTAALLTQKQDATGEYKELKKVEHKDGSVATTSVGLPPDAETIVVTEVAAEAPNASPTSEPSEPESAPVTYDDVKKATNALSAAKGRDVTIATLAVFNVQKATQLVEAQWADYVAYATKVASDA